MMKRWIIFMCVLIFTVSGYAATGKGQSVLRVALVQAHLAWGDVDRNLEAFANRVEKCGGCDLIVFPELFASGCEMKKGAGENNKEKVAERYEDIRLKMGEWAVRQNAVIMGSTIYQEDSLFYNRLIVAFPDGTYQYYDKHNCFKKGAFSPGKQQLIYEFRGFRVATYICYDIRFPEWSRNVQKYDLAVYVANWPASRREDWQKLLRERAMENKVFVVGVNCSGNDPYGLFYAGDSGIFASDGECLVCCEEGADDIKITEIRKE